MDFPSVLDLIKRWDRAFEWVLGKDRGLVVHAPNGRLVESSLACRLLVP